MQKRWLNDKKPDNKGEIGIVIETPEGRRVSTFKAKSFDALTEKLADSQIHANEMINRLLNSGTADIHRRRRKTHAEAMAK